MLNGADAKKLIHFVHEAQEARVALTHNFDSRFSDLVTAGKGDEYPQLVDRFKALYAACDASLETIATRLAAMPSASSASKIVTSIVREERSRFDAHLQVGGRFCPCVPPESMWSLQRAHLRRSCAPEPCERLPGSGGAPQRLCQTPLSSGSSTRPCPASPQVQVMRQHKSVAGAAGDEGVASTAEVRARALFFPRLSTYVPLAPGHLAQPSSRRVRSLRKIPSPGHFLVCVGGIASTAAVRV
jgi:hypothetical protein